MTIRGRYAARRLLPLVTAVAVLAALFAFSPAPDATAQAMTVEQINDDLGIGVNLGNALEGPREGDWGLTLEADFFPTIAEAGFGHVRLPVRFSGYAAQTAPYIIPDGIDPTVPNADNLWDRIDWVIANAEANNLYVIIDLHHYDELFDDVAGERDRFLAIWQQIADRYASASSRVLFEVLNEPHGQFNDDPALLTTLLEDVLDVIRPSNPTRPVLVGPSYWNSITSLGSLDLPNDPNLIVSVHFYEPFAFTHQGATWVNPVPPAPANFEGDLVDFGPGWGNWSWETSVSASSSSLNASFDRQWAGLGFGRPSLVDPASLRVVVSGSSELSVRCVSASGTDVEVTRITTTASTTTFNVNMASCPAQTQVINFMMASPTFDPLRFYEIELCETSGTCTRLVESGEQAIDSAFEAAAEWGQANGRPINVGEFGAYSAGGLADLGERAEWTELVRTAGERHGFSMTYWEFGAGFGVYNPSNDTWVDPLLDALGVDAQPPVEQDLRPQFLSPSPSFGARFGSTTASGDFNNDGFADLAVASPANGSVAFYQGTAFGLVAGSTVQGSSGFGTALAVGDFDGDGRDDVAIGNPEAATSGQVGAGRVTIRYGSGYSVSFHGDSAGLPGSAEAGDGFGSALAAGDFDGDGLDDLAIGIEGEALGSTQGAGALIILNGSGSGLQGSGAQWVSGDSAGTPGSGESYDHFGSALAAGDFDGDGAADLAVGIPGEDFRSKQNAGAVIVFDGSSTGIRTSSAQWVSGDSAGVPGSAETGDRFGSVLAVGELTGDSRADLVVGVPDEALGSRQHAGAALIFNGSSAGGVSTSTSTWISGNSAGVPGIGESGDRFGSVFAIGDYDGDGTNDLAVGVPGEALGTTSEAGAVIVFPDTGSGVGSSGGIWLSGRSAGMPGWGEQGDEFGAALALDTFDGSSSSLVIGIPGEAVGTVASAGAFIELAPAS